MVGVPRVSRWARCSAERVNREIRVRGESHDLVVDELICRLITMRDFPGHGNVKWSPKFPATATPSSANRPKAPLARTQRGYVAGRTVPARRAEDGRWTITARVPPRVVKACFARACAVGSIVDGAFVENDNSCLTRGPRGQGRGCRGCAWADGTVPPESAECRQRTPLPVSRTRPARGGAGEMLRPHATGRWWHGPRRRPSADGHRGACG